MLPVLLTCLVALPQSAPRVDPPGSALHELELQAGWRDLLSPEHLSSWRRANDDGFALEPYLLRRTGAGGADLVLELGAAPCEVRYEWRAPAEPRGVWSRVELVSDAAFGAGNPASADPAPLALVRLEGTGNHHLVLNATGPALEIRRLHLRDLGRFAGAWLELVRGDTLDGWLPSGDALWSAEDGAIRGRVGGGAQSFLRTARSFGDFRLELEFRLHGPGNSGVQVRSRLNPDGRVTGYQLEIDPSPRAWTGGLYDEGRRGWLQNLAERPAARAALDPHGWNHLRVECLGPWIRSWVNGVPATDHFDPLDLEGFLALQVHSGTDTDLTWRGLRLLDLGRRAWEEHGPHELLGRWVRTGAWSPGFDILVGQAGATLTAPGPQADFALRFELRARGGAGLHLKFRTVADTPLAPRREASGLMSRPVGWILDASDPAFPAHGDGWTRIALAVFGERVVLHANERLVADLHGVPIPRAGRLALEVTGAAGQVEVRRLRTLGPPR